MRILFTGDFFYDYDFPAPDLAELSRYIARRDCCCVLNFEGALASGAEKYAIKKRGVRLLQSSAAVDALKILNTKAVCLANNHVMDYGQEGLKKTLKLLDRSGIGRAGAGRNLKEALSPLILEDEVGGKLALFNFGWRMEETVCAGKRRPGCAPYEERLVRESICRFIDDNPAIPIAAAFHWGYEYRLYPMRADMGVARKLAALPQVKLIVGHHPHVVQPREIINGKGIYYSLGNFYFGGMRKNYRRSFDYPVSMPDGCAYGLGVILDTADWSHEPVGFLYDDKEDRTVITGVREELLEMPRVSDSREYDELVRSTSPPGRPVVGNYGLLSRLKTEAFELKRNWNTRVVGTLRRLSKGRSR